LSKGKRKNRKNKTKAGIAIYLCQFPVFKVIISPTKIHPLKKMRVHLII